MNQNMLEPGWAYIGPITGSSPVRRGVRASGLCSAVAIVARVEGSAKTPSTMAAKAASRPL